jgi:2-C-methyl-D-erythritol 2,4-cyclodiphosphate synthase
MDAGWEIANLDATVIAQAPKIAPHVAAMRANLASDLDCDERRISVKATTTERLGFTGREEGIATLATVLLQMRDRNAGP